MQRTKLGAAVLAAALAACGDPAGPPAPVGVIGAYTLRTVDGHPVPHELPQVAPGGAVEVVSGEARMGTGGVCAIAFVVRLVTVVGPGPSQPTEYDCTYTAEDPGASETAVLILVEGERQPSPGTYRDGRLAFTFPSGRALVFER